MKKKQSIVIIFLLLTGLIGMTEERKSDFGYKPKKADRCYSVCRHDKVMPVTKETETRARGGEMITSTSFFSN